MALVVVNRNDIVADVSTIYNVDRDVILARKFMMDISVVQLFYLAFYSSE